ncbi:alpha/beta hydrolase [Peribacillus cavernae]|uniref:Alpha/beta hydrolase n=1 Tax=Peribacillus cavernae TaxID=1674310 RepID=A0A3S0TZS8_9BACI|nr:alpha/beta fold hydrolase [Peribacillus cavernae]MDQ0217686.1 dipeptidyl aminopeptidase/acylaminoacyl peptidase [Peribacillus cavernae]RUQ28156.1 alpha/beta hydrolase [Peribacillus cavernae]
MIERQIHFYSEGFKLDGSLYLPDDYKPGEKRPAIIPNSGYQGFNEFYPKLFARNFTEAGYVCLGFDYRSFAKSEGGEGRVILDEQVEDIQNAITFLSIQEEVDPDRIGLTGWGMGASNVVRVAAKDKRIKAVAALNGFYNGERWLRSIHSYVEWIEILKAVDEDRKQRVSTGKSKLAHPFIHYPLDRATADYVDKELAILSAFGNQTVLQFTDSIINMNAEKTVKDVKVPLFIAHGEGNLLHPLDEAERLYESATEPKELYIIEGKHNDFMYHDHEVFQKLMGRLKDFFEVNVTKKEEIVKAV